MVAFSSFKISYLSFIGNDSNRTDSFLYFMSLENHSLQSVLPSQTDVSFGKDALALLTNINVRDMKTFLISEIPGLSAASPKIIIAGEGTDFTNLPIESPPPEDFGLIDDEGDKLAEELVDEKKMQTADHVAFIYHTHNRESFLPLLPEAKVANEAFNKDQNIIFAMEKDWIKARGKRHKDDGGYIRHTRNVIKEKYGVFSILCCIKGNCSRSDAAK